jgi:hypothetical protein
VVDDAKKRHNQSRRAVVRLPRAQFIFQKLEIERLGSGEYLFRRIEESPNSGLVDWLLACPVMDYFEPIPSELADSL